MLSVSFQVIPRIWTVLLHLRQSPKVAAMFVDLDMLFFEIFINFRLVLTLIASAIFIMPWLVILLLDTSSFLSVLFALRYSLIATAPSSDILLYDKSNFCILSFWYKNADIKIVPVFSKDLLAMSHNIPVLLNSVANLLSFHDITSVRSVVLPLRDLLKVAIPLLDTLLNDILSTFRVLLHLLVVTLLFLILLSRDLPIALIPSSDILLCEISRIWSAVFTCRALTMLLIAILDNLLYEILSSCNVQLLRHSLIPNSSSSDMLLCEISSFRSVVFICRALPIVIISTLDIWLDEILSSVNALLVLRHSLIATATSCEISLLEIWSTLT